MQLRSLKFFTLITLLFGLCFSIANAANQSDPIGLLQNIANNMIAGLKSNQATLKTKPQIVYRLANQYVVPHADLAEMSKRVVPRNVWDGATSAQRAQFEKEFTTLLIRTYASALTSYQGQVIQFYPIRGGIEGRSTVTVNSMISGSDGRAPIRVSYQVMREGSGWRLYDMSVEGVDMLESFRSQFSDILSQGNMDLLLKRLATHNRG